MAKLHGQYIRLKSGLSGDDVQITLDELAAILECTHRNVLHLIGKMQKLGWIEWTPSRGRGQRSRLQLLAPLQEVAAESLRESMDGRGSLADTASLIRSLAGTETLRESLQSWLALYSGHHVERRHDRVLDTLRLPVNQPIQTIDPLRMNLLAESFVSSHVYDGLVRRGPGSEDILPGLAHAWETDAGRTDWLFHLRKEVPMHNGAMLDAEDVAASFRRLIEAPEGRLYSFVLRDIEEVRVLNPLTLRIRLRKPNELFLSYLCTSRAAVVPHDPEQAAGSPRVHRPIGTGPFKVAEFTRDMCVLEAFSPYFLGRAHLDRVEILYIPWSAEPSAAESGSPFHVIPNPKDGHAGGWSRIQPETLIAKFITFNTKKAGPLSDPAIRAMLVSGLKNGTSSESISGLNLTIATIPQYAADAEYIASALEALGVSSEIIAVTPDEFKGPVRMQADLILFSLIRDRDEQLRRFDLYRSLAEHTTPELRSEIEAALHLIAREPSPEMRSDSFRRIEDRLISDHHLHILYEKPMETAYVPSVRGMSFNSQGWINLRHVWFPRLPL
ncbi:HTH-type transcriptional regulator SgrR [compost metagenome]